MKRIIIRGLVVVAVFALIGGVYVSLQPPPPKPKVFQAAVTRGDVIQSAIATGPVGSVRTVEVGSQVTGIVTKLYVDFNSIVHKDEILADIDPTLAKAAVGSAQAALDRAQISLAQDNVVLKNDQVNLRRMEDLLQHQIETPQDKELAALTVAQDQAQIKEDDSAISIAKTTLAQAVTNLGYCTIRSPVDGVVVTRNVDEGQTVQASIVAPTLYLLATNLTTLQVEGDVDELDVGRVRVGQQVDITVDAYPTTTFIGHVAQVRLNTVTINNVVTYQVMITAPNPDYKLRPGMTATNKIEIWRADNALRVPNTAVRFHPTPEMFTAYNQPVPAIISTPPPPPSMAPKPILPAVIDRQASTKDRTVSTIDALQEPPPRPDDKTDLWVMTNAGLVDVPVHLGITDGTWSEVLSGDLRPDEQLITSIALPKSAVKPVTTTPTPTPAPATTPIKK